jgi:hypothetical protein
MVSRRWRKIELLRLLFYDGVVIEMERVVLLDAP